MSTFVVKSEALQLPNSFVEIDRDEMEYLEGGAVINVGIFTSGESKGIAASIIMDIGISTAIASVNRIVLAVSRTLGLSRTGAITAISDGIIAASGGTVYSTLNYSLLASNLNGLDVFANTLTKKVSVSFKK